MHLYKLQKKERGIQLIPLFLIDALSILHACPTFFTLTVNLSCYPYSVNCCHYLSS